MITPIFKKFFDDYKIHSHRIYLRYVITSTDRPNDPVGSPHKMPGNAIDFTLRNYEHYSGINEYNDLFAYMFDNWDYRAGIDNTEGNVHIHIDLGLTQVTDMPYFFKEDGGVFKYRIKNKSQI